MKRKLALILVLSLALLTMGGVYNIVRAQPDTPRYFESVQEAEAWVAENQLPIVLVAGEDGVIEFRINQDPRYDCDDYAEDFETAALNAGYRIWQAPVQNGRIWGVWVTDIPGNHVGNMTKIQNAYYYIESSPSPNRWKLTKIMEAD